MGPNWKHMAGKKKFSDTADDVIVTNPNRPPFWTGTTAYDFPKVGTRPGIFASLSKTGETGVVL